LPGGLKKINLKDNERKALRELRRDCLRNIQVWKLFSMAPRQGEILIKNPILIY